MVIVTIIIITIIIRNKCINIPWISMNTYVKSTHATTQCLTWLWLEELTDLWEVCWAFVTPVVECDCAIRGTPGRKWRYAKKLMWIPKVLRWFRFQWYSHASSIPKRMLAFQWAKMSPDTNRMMNGIGKPSLSVSCCCPTVGKQVKRYTPRGKLVSSPMITSDHLPRLCNAFFGWWHLMI